MFINDSNDEDKKEINSEHEKNSDTENEHNNSNSLNINEIEIISENASNNESVSEIKKSISDFKKIGDEITNSYNFKVNHVFFYI